MSPYHAASESSVPAQFRGAAFLLDISTLRRTVKVTAPSAARAALFSPAGDATTQRSLLGGDVIEIGVTNYTAGRVGETAPGKVLVTFDLTIYNKLVGIALTSPSFPTPPASVTGVQAFPFEITVLTTAGGVAVSGSEIMVASPRFGVATPSSHWDGAPHNFFNDVGCTATANDCFRYEPFGIIAPQGASAKRQVGFLVDPTVGDLRVRMILAADLSPVGSTAADAVAR